MSKAFNQPLSECLPLAGKRDIVVTEKRTAADWARQVRDLVDKRCPEAERITLVMDNLNTHAGASLYNSTIKDFYLDEPS